jgi:hypothetical protein
MESAAHDDALYMTCSCGDTGFLRMLCGLIETPGEKLTMLSATIEATDGTLLPVKRIWTEYPRETPGIHNVAVNAGDILYRRVGLLPHDAAALHELVIAGGTFDERLNKLSR